MFFRDIIGQDLIKERMIQSVQTGEIPHAQLITGKEGVGKYALALALARYLNCTKRSESDACGVCPSCVKVSKLIHPDIHFAFPIVTDSKKGKFVCDDYLPEWRKFVLNDAYFTYQQWLRYLGETNKQAIIYCGESEQILHKLNLKPFESDYKTLIIWLPEKMNIECANKLLKIIEEPPEKTFLLLISEQPDGILSTIQSRSQRINVKAILPEKMEIALQSRFSLAESDAHAVAHIAAGSMTQAKEVVEQSAENSYLLERFVLLMRGAYSVGVIRDPAKKSVGLRNLKEWSEELAKYGRERQKAFFAYCQHMLRENFVMNQKQPQLNYLTPGEDAFSSRFHIFVSEKNIVGLMNEFGLAEAHISQNVNPKMVFFDLALKTIVWLLQNNAE
ncbi:MAG: DNA polymerase III subunit delta [Bacteroidales bacterium]|jgi:DNA polymerase-3 subunit delta'|nr:DNA polymerase III subunit delta [Bacteroidales bacterium]